MPSIPNHELCIHEKDIIGQSRKIAELEAKSKFKESAIEELKADNKRMEDKIDNIATSVNEILIQSKQDDKDLELRLNTIETRLDSQEKFAREQKELAKDNQNELTRKTNLRIAIIGVIVSIIALIPVLKSLFGG